MNLAISAGPSGLEEAWEFMLRARARKNAYFCVYCNVTGKQKDSFFFGGTTVVAPDGKVLTEAKLDAEDFSVATIDIEQIHRWRRQQFIFRDRAPPLYTDLVRPPSQDMGQMLHVVHGDALAHTSLTRDETSKSG